MKYTCNKNGIRMKHTCYAESMEIKYTCCTKIWKWRTPLTSNLLKRSTHLALKVLYLNTPWTIKVCNAPVLIQKTDNIAIMMSIEYFNWLLNRNAGFEKNISMYWKLHKGKALKALLFNRWLNTLKYFPEMIFSAVVKAV